MAAAAAFSLLLTLSLYLYEDTPVLSLGSDNHDPTAGIVSGMVMVGTSLALLFVQYRTRLRVWSCAIGVIGVMTAYQIPSDWPWPVWAPAITTPTWAADPAMLALAANAETVSLEQSRSFRNRPQDWKLARAGIRMRGIEPGWTASVGVREAAVRVP